MDRQQRFHEFLRQRPTGGKTQYGRRQHMFIAAFGPLQDTEILLRNPAQSLHRLGAIDRNLHTIWPDDMVRIRACAIAHRQHMIEQLLRGGRGACIHRQYRIGVIAQQPLPLRQLRGKPGVKAQPILRLEWLNAGQWARGKRIIGNGGLENLCHALAIAPLSKLCTTVQFPSASAVSNTPVPRIRPKRTCSGSHLGTPRRASPGRLRSKSQGGEDERTLP